MAKGIDVGKMRLFPLERYSISVTDGDTLLLIGDGKKVRVRLAGIDAPELAKPGLSLGQTGAINAIRYLQSVINKYRSQLQLYVDPTAETHGRVVGVLVVGERNINLELVEQGLATAYIPPSGAPGIRFKPYATAEKRAVAEGRGIYGSKFFQAKYAQEQAIGKRLTNVALATFDADFNSRVQGRVIKGMARGDHTQSTYGGFMGMNPDRLDFTGSREPTNPISMKAIQDMYAKLGLKSKDLLMSLDIETSGTDPSSFTTFAGFVDVSAGESAEYFINPKLPYAPGHPSGGGRISTFMKSLFGMGEFSKAERYRRRQQMNAAKRSGGYMVGSGPHGEPLTKEWVEKRLNESELPLHMRRQQLTAMKTHSAMDPEDFMRLVFKKFEEKKSGWVFIHNATFESDRLGPAIPEDVWARALQEGHIAAGYENRRHMFNAFDKQLTQFKTKAYAAIQEKNPLEAAKYQAAWVDRFQSLFTGAESTVGGVKFIDTQDIAKGVFAKAHLAGHFQKGVDFSTHGLMSQDAIAALMGLPAEVHMPVPDAEQNLYVVGKLLEIHKQLEPGQILKAESKAFFTKAESLHSDLQLFALYRDMAGQLRGADSIKSALEFNIQVRGDVPTMETARGIKYEGGTKYEIENGIAYRVVNGQKLEATEAIHDVYPVYLHEPTTAVEYARKRLETLGITDISPEELVTKAYEGKTAINELSQSEIVEMLSEKKFTDLKEMLQDRHIALMAATSEKAVEKSLKKAVVKPKGFSVRAWVESLHPSTKKVAAGIGGIAAVLGVLGFLRGFTEKKRDAQPQTMYSMEEYQAMRQQGVHNNHQNGDLASMMASFRMVPNRYPTKV